MRIRVVMDMRITSVMRNRNFVINHRTVQRLMQSMGIKSRIRKVRYRSIRANLVESCTNIINSDFVAQAPNQKWATYVSQINSGSTKLYLSPMIDMFNGKPYLTTYRHHPIWSRYTFEKYDKLDGLIIHSDQGRQYQHFGYRQRLEEIHIIQSIPRKGNCLDNAMAENFSAS